MLKSGVRRIHLVVVSIMAFMVCLGAACGGDSTPAPKSEVAVATPIGQRYGGTLRLFWDDPANADPHQSTSQEYLMGNNLYNNIVRPGVISGFSPELAKSWAIAADGLEISLELQEDVRFHNGDTLTCEDVKYSYDRNLNPPEGLISARKSEYTPQVASVRCDGKLKVVFTMTAPWGDAMENMSTPRMVIYNKKIAQASDLSGKLMRSPEEHRNAGTGAFKLDRYVVDDILRMTRNDDYWRPGLPFLDAIEIFPSPGALGTVAAFKTGRINLIHGVETPTVAKDLAGGGSWMVTAGPKAFFNVIVPNVQTAPWNDIEVRKALALATIQDEFIETACDIGFACWFPQMLAIGNPNALPEAELRSIPGYGMDANARRAEARSILASKGLSDLSITMVTRGDLESFREVAVVACDQLSKAGINCTNENMEVGPYYDMVNAKQIPAGGVVYHSIGPGLSTIDATLKEAFHPDGVRNYGGYEDDHLKQLYDQQFRELDEAKRRELLFEYQRYFINQYYFTLTSIGGAFDARWNNIHGMEGFSPHGSWPTRWDGVWISE